MNHLIKIEKVQLKILRKTAADTYVNKYLNINESIDEDKN